MAVSTFFVPLSKFGPAALLYLANWVYDGECFAQAVLIPPTAADEGARGFSRVAQSRSAENEHLLRAIVVKQIEAEVRELILAVPSDERVTRIELREATGDELRIAAFVGLYLTRAYAANLAHGTELQTALNAELRLHRIGFAKDQV